MALGVCDAVHYLALGVFDAMREFEGNVVSSQVHTLDRGNAGVRTGGKCVGMVGLHADLVLKKNQCPKINLHTHTHTELHEELLN